MVSRARRPSPFSRASSVRLVVLLVVVALATGIAATVATASSLPSCRVADKLTQQRSYAAWNRTVLDTTYRLGSGYYPGDLRSTVNAGLNSGHRVRAFVIADLKAMARAARAAGARLAVQSAFRSYSTQKSTFAYWSRVSGYSAALRSSARAGHSEHQLGTTIDFRSYGGSAPWYYSRLGHDQGRSLAQEERLEIWLRDGISEGQDERHLLRLRAVALPLHGSIRSGEGAEQRADPAAIPLASADGAGPDTHTRPRPRRRAPTERPAEQPAERRTERSPERRRRAARRASHRSCRAPPPPRPNRHPSRAACRPRLRRPKPRRATHPSEPSPGA